MAIRSTSQQLPSWLNHDWFWGLILIVAIFLTYSPVWHAGFVWDDFDQVTSNPNVVGPSGLREIWTTKAAQICPLVLSTFWVEHALWGFAPLPYHLVNVIVHGLSAVMLWQLLLGLRIPGAWLGAALWALHPVQVESVAWITELKNIQSGLFYLLTLHFFVRGLRAKADARQGGSGWNYIFMLMCAALAIGSKTSTVVLPLVLCLCAWWVEGQWNWRNVIRIAPVFLMSIAGVVLTLWAQGLHPATVSDPRAAHTLAGHLAAAGGAVWFYLGKLLWPHPLITIYPLWNPAIGSPLSYLPLLAVGIILFLLWRNLTSGTRPYFFAFAYFLAAMLPELELADSYLADHYQYLSSMGPLALAGAGMARLAGILISARPLVQAFLGAGVLLLLGTLSWQRSLAYESEEKFWSTELAQNSNSWVIYHNLGDVSLKEGKIDDAIVRYQEALAIEPANAKTRNNLGNAFLKAGRVDEAIEQYKKALESSPTDSRMRYDLGYAFAQKGLSDDAISQFQQALVFAPGDFNVHCELGRVFFDKGRLDEALAEFKECLEIDSRNPSVRNYLGITFARNGQLDDAIAQFQEALRIKPDYAEAQRNLAQAQELVRRKPNH